MYNRDYPCVHHYLQPAEDHLEYQRDHKLLRSEEVCGRCNLWKNKEKSDILLERENHMLQPQNVHWGLSSS